MAKNKSIVDYGVAIIRKVFGIEDPSAPSNDELIRIAERARAFELSESDEKDTEDVQEDDDIYTTQIDDKIYCPKCASEMHRVSSIRHDFGAMRLYDCKKCNTISEYQYVGHDDELSRIVHIMNNKQASDTSAYMEAEGIINYDKFSLDRLWAIGGVLCYPVLVKSEFTNKGSLVFIKVGANISYNSVEGFLINSSNVIGHIKMMRSDNISHFCNPYLSNLPHPNIVWLGTPTMRCAQLEVVLNIRFKHTITGKPGMWVHKLLIIKDNPLRAMGLEVFVRFYSVIPVNEEHPMSMGAIIKKIDLKSIILGTSEFETDSSFGIQVSSVCKHTLSAVSRDNISIEAREDLYESAVKFFNLYDEAVPKHYPVIEQEEK